MPTRVLLLDGEQVHTHRLQQHLQAHACFVVCTPFSRVDELLSGEHFDLVLIDEHSVPLRPAHWMQWMLRKQPHARCVVISRNRTVSSALRWMKAGALDYVEKPLTPKVLEKHYTEWFRELFPVFLGVPATAEDFPLPHVQLCSEAMHHVHVQAQRWAQHEGPMLFCGESGTEARWIAQWMHTHSARGKEPFRMIEPTEGLPWQQATWWRQGPKKKESIWMRLPEGVLQNPLFHEMWHSPREKVQWYLECTGNPPAEWEELPRLHIPALRERPEDILPWAQYWIHHWALHAKKPIPVLTRCAKQFLLSQKLPGNVEQIRLLMKKVIHSLMGTQVTLAHLQAEEPTPPSRIPLGSSLRAAEQQLLLHTLRLFDGNKTAAAKTLGISRRALYNKLAAYGIHNLRRRG